MLLNPIAKNNEDSVIRRQSLLTSALMERAHQENLFSQGQACEREKIDELGLSIMR